MRFRDILQDNGDDRVRRTGGLEPPIFHPGNKRDILLRGIHHNHRNLAVRIKGGGRDKIVAVGRAYDPFCARAYELRNVSQTEEEEQNHRVDASGNGLRHGHPAMVGVGGLL